MHQCPLISQRFSPLKDERIFSFFLIQRIDLVTSVSFGELLQSR